MNEWVTRLFVKQPLASPGSANKRVSQASAFSSKSSQHHKSQTVRARKLKCWENVHPPPCVTFQVSRVRCQVSGVTYHCRWRVCYQRGLRRVVWNIRLFKYKKSLIWYSCGHKCYSVYEVVKYRLVITSLMPLAFQEEFIYPRLCFQCVFHTHNNQTQLSNPTQLFIYKGGKQSRSWISDDSFCALTVDWRFCCFCFYSLLCLNS